MTVNTSASTAYVAAFDYFTIALEFLASDCWQNQYNLALTLNIAAAETAYLTGNFPEQERLTNLVLERGRSLLDKVKIYEIKILALVAQARLREAVEIAIQILLLLGIYFSMKPSILKILYALIKSKISLIGKRVESLIDLPKMKDPHKLAAMRIMGIMGSPAYNAAPELMPLIALEGINLSIKYGNSFMSAYGYASYGVILCGVLEDIEGGYRFGQLALNLLEQFNPKELKARTLFVFNNFIRHWKESVNSGLKSLLDAYKSGLETGDLEFAAYSAYIYCYHSYFIGKELTQLDTEMATYAQAIASLKQEAAVNWLRLYQQVVSNLQESKNPSLLIGDSFKEQEMLPRLLETNNQTAIFDLYFNKLILSYLFGEYSQALDNAVAAKKYLEAARSTISVPIFYFYESLARLSTYASASWLEKKFLLKKVNTNQKKLKKWAHHAPMNYLHKYYLVEAEKFRILQQNLQAIDNYDRAIKLDKENGYIQEEALAQELAANFYFGWKKETVAEIYLTQAYYSYARWGAQAKVEELKRRYPESLLSVTVPPVTRLIENNLMRNTAQVLDLATILKASQTLSEEIQLDCLIVKLMEILMSHAGAEVGSLILAETNKLTVATRCIGILECHLINTPVEFSQNLPIAIINYVWRTQEIVVTDDAANETRWMSDPYIVQQQPKSILCVPLLNRGKLLGILYLENNLTTKAFTNDRQEIVNLLATQAAISLENASLYDNLKRSEAREREKAIELQQSLEELKQTQIQLLETQEKLLYDAFHDALTGLPNRAWFMKLLERAVLLSLRHPSYLYAVLFLDLDRFKVVNDSFGHLVGDELLQNVATRLKSCLRATDTVARLGGDEFAILLEELQDEQEAIIVAQRIQEQLSIPFKLDGYEIQTGTSIGIAVGNLSYQRSQEVLRDADAAMYYAKAQGKGRYAVFDPQMQI